MTKLTHQVRDTAQAIADDETRNGAMYDRRAHEWDNTALAASVGGGSHSGTSDPTAKAALRTPRHNLPSGVRRLAQQQFINAAENLRRINAEYATAIDDPMIEVMCDNHACLAPVWVLTSDTIKSKAPPLCDGCTLSYKRSGQLPNTEQVAARNKKRAQRKVKA
jgi:hypothetical protein